MARRVANGPVAEISVSGDISRGVVRYRIEMQVRDSFPVALGIERATGGLQTCSAPAHRFSSCRIRLMADVRVAMDHGALGPRRPYPTQRTETH